jgi:hypothetical protein
MRLLIALLLLPTLVLAQSEAPSGAGGGGGYTPPSTAAATTAELTYYVSSSGDDDNSCTDSGEPCLTINGALAKIPTTLIHATTVSVGAGTFDGFILDGFTVRQLGASTSNMASLDIVGTMQAPTLASGVTSGTVTSYAAASGNTYPVVTVTGAGWTSNDLRGKFFRATGGTGTGRTYAIAENTATTITLAGGVTAMDATTTFSLLESATTITCNLGLVGRTATPWQSDVAATSSRSCVMARNLGQGSAASSFSSYLPYRIVGFVFSGGTVAVDMRDVFGLELGWNKFVSQTGTGAGSPAVLLNNSINPTLFHNYAVLIADKWFASQGSAGINGATRGLYAAGNVVSGGGFYGDSFTSLDNGLFLSNYVTGGDHNVAIFYFDGTVGMVSMTTNRVSGNADTSGSCVQVGGSAISIGSSLGGTLRFNGGVYNSCRHGLALYGPAVDVTVTTGTLEGTGNARFGILARNGATVRTATSTLTGTLGDLSFDDAAAITYATVVGATQVDAVLGGHFRNSP